MTVLHTVASLRPDTGGPARTVSALCAHLAEQGLSVEIVSRRQEGGATFSPDHSSVNTTFATKNDGLRGGFAFRHVLADRLSTVEPVLVHDHGIWLPTNLVSAVEAWRHGCPFVVTTRGMLEPWALNHRKWKKRLAWYGYQRWILQQADLLHATAPTEAEHLRELGLSAPIAVIPNGVSLPQTWKQEASGGPERQALFLSRIHPKKGLPMLLDAWAELRPSNWHLMVVGPDENNHRAALDAQVRDRGLTDSVEFRGPVSDEEKWPLYRESDLFVLPTHSENFGVVVAEALASGIPVITTTGAPWSVLKEQNCGWWVDPSVDALENALSDAVSRTDKERIAMGRRGRTLVEDQFSWTGVAQKLKATYHWVLGEETRPDFVRVT